MHWGCLFLQTGRIDVIGQSRKSYHSSKSKKMAKTKFTPGKWQAKKYTNDSCIAGWVETEEDPVARVENAGDLHLIAQAPAKAADEEITT